MIIELSDSFQMLAVDDWIIEQPAIERLISAHANGWHMLSMSRDTAVAMTEHCDLSATQRAILKAHILPRLTTILSQARSVSCGVHCVPTNHQLTAVHQRVTLPLSYFNNPEAALPAYVIVESIESDAAFLTFLTEHLGKSAGFAARANLTFLAGGGGSTANRYEEVAGSGRAAICVVDSDRVHPGSPLGQTPTAVLAVVTAQPLARVILLDVREMENLIPFPVLAEVYGSNPNAYEVVSKTGEFIKGDDVRAAVIARHFDIKDGIHRSFLRKLDIDSLGIWKDLWKVFHPSETLYDISVAAGSDVIIKGVSKRAIATTIEFYKDRPHRCKSLAKELHKFPFADEVLSLVREILSLSTAADRIRTPLAT